jgi:hypothetical protein
MYCNDSANDAPAQRRKTVRRKSRHQAWFEDIDWKAFYRKQKAIVEELADCCAEYVLILKSRHPVTLHYYDLNGVPETYRAGSMKKLREFLSTFPFGLRSLWYRLGDSKKCHSFPFDDFTPLDRLRHIRRHLVFDQPDDVLNVSRALAMDPRDVIARLGSFNINLWRMRRSVPKGKRSDLIFKLAMDAFEAGATKNDVACLLWASAPFRSKYGDQTYRLEREVERLWSKSPWP